MTFNSIKIHNNLPLKYDELRIDFFTNNKGKYKEKRVNLIYGRNGVGKTTLSRSLKNYTDDDTEIVVFLDKNNNILDPNDVCPIHVYNEDFIKENFIFTKDSNLNAIVMTGESEEIEKEIEGHKENCSKLEDEFSKLTEENKAIRENYKSALKKLKNELRGSNSWAERDSSIRNKNSKKNSTVNEDTILKFKNLFDEIKDELYEKGNLKNNYGEIVSRKITSIDTNLSETINALNKARNEQSLIKLNLVYQIDNNIEENIDYILNKTLDRDSDTDIADDLSKNIMKTYETEGLKHIGSGFDKLKKQLETEQNYCPMCFQQINDEYIKMLQNKLNEIREKELKNNVVEKFKKEIEEYKIAKISFDNDLKLDDEFSSYFLQEQQKLKELIDEYNGIVNSINNILEDKKDKLYTSVNNELSGQISNKYRFLLEYIKEINQKIYAHNKSLADQDKLICKATMENNKYTLYTYLKEFSTIYSLYKEIKTIDNGEKDEKSEYNSLKKQIEIENVKIQDLKSQMEQISIAVDEINKRINYITYNEGQIKIQAEDHKYYVLVNNEKIALDKLSTGQRNLISLSYFFTKINENYSEKEFYSNEILLVLDDPISSFDHSNRLGIMSLLRYEIGSILLSNEKSKILIQSHDTGVIFDLKNILKNIEEERKVNPSNSSNKIHCEVKEIRNHKENPLINYEPEKTYGKLMTNIYMFGNGEFDNNEIQAELSIGNNIRRVLEAFSTFNYNNGITYLTNNDEVLNLLGSKDIQNYYKNLMNHLVLNSESHLKEKAEAITDYNFMPLYPYNEKQKLARDTISFLYLLDSLHVKNNIISDLSKDNIKEMEEKIKSWIPNF